MSYTFAINNAKKDLSHQKTIEEKRNKLNEDHELLKTQVDELMKNKDGENNVFLLLFGNSPLIDGSNVIKMLTRSLLK